MKLIVPDYYPQFQCIAGACKHSCCIGWEIDIDPDKLDTYKNAQGSIGERLRKSIDFDCDCPHFVTNENDRCPFLNKENLCDLIIEMGEEALCDICNMHPRFRNDFADRTELGLGLCCEEAARLMLTHAQPMTFLTLEDDGCDEGPEEDEAYLYALRRNALAIAQDREFTVTERMEHLSDFFGFPLPAADPKHWAEVFLGLERLDEAWSSVLETLKTDFTPKSFPQWETAFEQLLVYFLFRHLPTALWDGDTESKIAFGVLSVQLLMWLCSAKETVTFEDLLEFSRMYASEIEYSDENPDVLFSLLGEEE